MKPKYIIPLALVAIGAYLILRKKKDDKAVAVNPLPEKPSSEPTKPSSEPTKPKPSTASADIWIVNTMTSPLQLRPTPSTSLNPIGSYPKGSEINARPSVVSGWHEVLNVSKSFPIVIGYVSSKYLVKK